MICRCFQCYRIFQWEWRRYRRNWKSAHRLKLCISLIFIGSILIIYLDASLFRMMHSADKTVACYNCLYIPPKKDGRLYQIINKMGIPSEIRHEATCDEPNPRDQRLVQEGCDHCAIEIVSKGKAAAIVRACVRGAGFACFSGMSVYGYTIQTDCCDQDFCNGEEHLPAREQYQTETKTDIAISCFHCQFVPEGTEYLLENALQLDVEDWDIPFNMHRCLAPTHRDGHLIGNSCNQCGLVTLSKDSCRRVIYRTCITEEDSELCHVMEQTSIMGYVVNTKCCQEEFCNTGTKPKNMIFIGLYFMLQLSLHAL